MSPLPPTTAATGSRKGSKKVAKGPSTKITKKARGIPIPSPPRPSAAAAVIFDTPGSLGLLAHILSFVGEHQYRFVAPTNRQFNEAYLLNFPDKTTKLDASTLARTKICWTECDHDTKVYLMFTDLVLDPHDETALLASAETHRDIPSLQYLFYKHKSFGHNLCDNAADNGDFRELKWLRSIGCPWNECTCAGAANRGDLEMLQWCRSHGCPWDAGSIDMAALSGHLHVVKWCRANGCSWNENSCSFAAKGRHLDVLKWLRKEGCPWDTTTLDKALSKGCTDIVQWCLENGLPRDGRCYCARGWNAHTKALLLKWCQGNGCTRGTTGL